METEPVQSHAPLSDARPGVLNDEEFSSFCEVWAEGEQTAPRILQRFGIGPGQWWRILNAAHRRHNREHWRFACECRREYQQMMKEERQYKKALESIMR